MIPNNIHHISQRQLEQEINAAILEALSPILEENKELQHLTDTKGDALPLEFCKALSDLDWVITNVLRTAKNPQQAEAGPHPTQ